MTDILKSNSTINTPSGQKLDSSSLASEAPAAYEMLVSNVNQAIKDSTIIAGEISTGINEFITKLIENKTIPPQKQETILQEASNYMKLVETTLSNAIFKAKEETAIGQTYSLLLQTGQISTDQYNTKINEIILPGLTNEQTGIKAAIKQVLSQLVQDTDLKSSGLLKETSVFLDSTNSSTSIGTDQE
jgi:hypothetical protein